LGIPFIKNRKVFQMEPRSDGPIHQFGVEKPSGILGLLEYLEDSTTTKQFESTFAIGHRQTKAASGDLPVEKAVEHPIRTGIPKGVFARSNHAIRSLFQKVNPRLEPAKIHLHVNVQVSAPLSDGPRKTVADRRPSSSILRTISLYDFNIPHPFWKLLDPCAGVVRPPVFHQNQLAAPGLTRKPLRKRQNLFLEPWSFMITGQNQAQIHVFRASTIREISAAVTRA
jgi:hypothetical protein